MELKLKMCDKKLLAHRVLFGQASKDTIALVPLPAEQPYFTRNCYLLSVRLPVSVWFGVNSIILLTHILMTLWILLNSKGKGISKSLLVT